MKKKKKIIHRFFKKVLFVLVGLGLIGGLVFFLKSLTISKKLPQELVVKVEKRNAQAIIKAGEEFFVIDDQGFVLQKTKIRTEIKQDLPVILIDSFSQTEVAWTANLLEKIKFYLFTPQETKILSSRNIEVKLDKGLLVIFSSQKEMDFQLDSLQFIFSRAKIEGRKIKKIDLRFDKPVVVYE